MRRILLAAVIANLLSTPNAHAQQNLLIGIGFGGVVPTGRFADGYSAGFEGSGSIGVMSGRFGLRLRSGSVEPRTRGKTNDALSARIGRPIKVRQAIVPVELQALYLFPLGSSPVAFRFQAGMGGSDLTLRIAGTDNRLEDEWRFGMSGGVGLSSRWRSSHGRIGVSGVFHRVFEKPYAIDYFTGELELTILF